MRLSVILLVAVAFVASLDSTAAASDANIVVAAAPTNVHESNRFLRVRNEDEYPAKDEGYREGYSFKAFKRLVAQSGDDLVTAVSGLTKDEVEALFNQGKAHMANMVPGFSPGMSLDDFGAAVRSAGVSDDMENALMYNAERVCGYATQLKEDDNHGKPKNGEDANLYIKFRLTGRFRKATEWSQRQLLLGS